MPSKRDERTGGSERAPTNQPFPYKIQQQETTWRNDSVRFALPSLSPIISPSDYPLQIRRHLLCRGLREHPRYPSVRMSSLSQSGFSLLTWLNPKSVSSTFRKTCAPVYPRYTPGVDFYSCRRLCGCIVQVQSQNSLAGSPQNSWGDRR